MNLILEWSKLDLKGKTSGVIHTTCPDCSEGRKKKSDKCVKINISLGLAKCFHCGALFFKDSSEKKQNEISVKYNLPEQKWHNYSNLSDNLVKWFENRGIKQMTLIENNITEESCFFSQKAQKMGSIVFNYFEGEVLVDKKYRSRDKDFAGTKNAKKIFYGLNDIIGADEVYIVEGEIDKLSFWQIGVKNVMSLPNGANDNDAVWINCEKYLRDVKKFYIATDNDEAGEKVSELIAQRLGRYRCERLMYFGKDANEDLVSGVLEKSIYNTKKYPVAGTYGIDDLWDQMLIDLEAGPPLQLKPKRDWAIDLNNIFCMLESQLSVGTGIPSHGKSTFTDWYLLNISQDYNKKISWFSPEHGSNNKYMAKIASKAIGKHFDKATPELRNEFREWARERLYLTSADMGIAPTWDWIFETFKEQMLIYGVNIFVVDAFNKLELPKGEERQQIKVVLSKLSNFCIQYNVNVILVAHPTKMQKDQSGVYEIPDLYSVSGSADFRNQTHNGYCIYRYFGEEERTVFANLKVKDTDYQGEIGAMVEFDYNVTNGRYHKRGSLPDNLPIWKNENEKPNYQQQIENIPIEKINDVFGDMDFKPLEFDDNLPF